MLFLNVHSGVDSEHRLVVVVVVDIVYMTVLLILYI